MFIIVSKSHSLLAIRHSAFGQEHVYKRNMAKTGNHTIIQFKHEKI
jgi:hypothetical protein